MGVVFEYYPGKSISNSQYFDGYVWSASPVYKSVIDPKSYGQSLGILRRSLVGSQWDNNVSNVGTRSIMCNSIPTRNDISSLSTRGCRIGVLSWGDLESAY